MRSLYRATCSLKACGAARSPSIFLSATLLFCILAIVITSKRYPPQVTPSSGNIFADLGFGEAEAESLRIRSTLMVAVLKVIKDRDLTQADAAKLFGVTRTQVSDLVRGRIDLFSIDTLVDMLARAGAPPEHKCSG